MKHVQHCAHDWREGSYAGCGGFGVLGCGAGYEGAELSCAEGDCWVGEVVVGQCVYSTYVNQGVLLFDFLHVRVVTIAFIVDTESWRRGVAGRVGLWLCLARGRCS
jgi:hypothetical protein